MDAVLLEVEGAVVVALSSSSAVWLVEAVVALSEVVAVEVVGFPACTLPSLELLPWEEEGLLWLVLDVVLLVDEAEPRKLKDFLNSEDV